MAGSSMRGGPAVRSDPGNAHAMAVFDRDVVSVASARDWLHRFLDQHAVSSSVSADAALVLSELVTNALRHGLGDIMTLGSLSDEEIRMSVTDAGDELPDVLPSSPGRIGGLGLHVVGSVADNWGVASFPGGKTVWATLQRRP
jgi:anti-sigma regulatory factor (Ser/Thr protein kinase)